MSSPSTVLVTGATGLLGRLVATALLSESDVRLVLPVRRGHTSEAVLANLRADLKAGGLRNTALDARVKVVPLVDQRLAALPLLVPGAWDLIHCAGCLDYFDDARLEEVNVRLTERMLALAEKADARRFVFVSTAFSCGMVNGLVRELPHPDPAGDPTSYTRSKRAAERRVLRSPVPSIIVRPSVVIGDSRSGCYEGKRYGLYQLWEAYARICTRRYAHELHIVAPKDRRPNLVHQDAFQAALLAAWRYLPDDAVMHVVSRDETLPSLRDLWLLWLEHVPRPRTLYCYDRLEQVDLSTLDRRTRMWVEFTGVNLDISTHPFRFDMSTRRRLEEQGRLAFSDATCETVAVCERAFIEKSPRLQAFIHRYPAELAIESTVVEAGNRNR